MKAVFLDSDTMPLSFEREGPIQWVLRSSTKPFEVVSALLDVEIAITNKVNLTASILEQLPKLKYVCVAASGYD
nr:hypothetical protein [Pseudomonas sp. MWU13-2105]